MCDILPAQPYFIAILPKGELRDEILDRKSQVHRLVGPQLYLEDPPHLTVFLACFQDRSELMKRFHSVSRSISSFDVRIEGWHVFENDCLTGNHTLVLKIADASKSLLRGIQQDVLTSIAECRDRDASMDRYLKSWESLSEARKASVKECGFPFTGEDWQPHFTIASIRPTDWSPAWDALRDRPVAGLFSEFAIAVFELADGVPRLIEELRLT